MNNSPNPFNITTAVDYSDEEINKYWVDFVSYDKNFPQLMKPESPMPMLILGGKGSGKTHIMRYFSFNSKKISYGPDFLNNLAKDRYLGIYLRCGGLNSSRFQGSNFSEDAWKGLFAYYTDLWFSQLLLQIVEEIINIANCSIDEKLICDEVCNSLFDKKITSIPNTIHGLRALIRDLQKQMDYEINNCSITGKSSIDLAINVSPGRLIFGIPKILEGKIDVFKGFQFIFLIDEFENLAEYQQRYINTLVREREAPVTFRVGARWYGMKTYKTYSGDEDIKQGSEYEKYIIDKMFRENDQSYDQFVKEICLKRIRESGYSLLPTDSSDYDFSNYYEEFDLKNYFKKLAEKGGRIGHFISLRSKLKIKLKQSEIDLIVDNLSFNKDILLERTNVFIFYRQWRQSKKLSLVSISKKIKEDLEVYLANSDQRPETSHYKVLDKFKSDIIDQLFKESQEKIPYTGFDKLTKMSAGIPRLLLITLKHIHRWSVFKGELPFRKDLITNDAQIKGVEEASAWFLEDARIPGADGRRIGDTIARLGQFFQELRFADVPPECSISSFSINLNDINEDIRTVLNYLEQYSYLINVADRTEKNSVRKFLTYQINGVIAPKWSLSINRRGIIQLHQDEVNAIFGNNSEQFESLRKSKLNKYNAPFSEANFEQSLFEDIEL